MNPRSVLVPVGFLLGLASAATALGKPLADIVSAEKRRSIVELAQLLTRPPEPVPLPADLAQPMNPPGFDQPDPEEIPGLLDLPGILGHKGLKVRRVQLGLPEQLDQLVFRVQ